MSEFLETDDRRAVLKNKLRQYFDGKIVRFLVSTAARMIPK